MGNCLFGGIEEGEIVEVMTSNNGIMEFVCPITVEQITDEFPGHGVFTRRHGDLFWKPIPVNQSLKGGESYYLLPLNKVKVGELGHHVRLSSSSFSPAPALAPAPYRMSFDSHGVFKRSYTQGHANHKKKQLGGSGSGFGFGSGSGSGNGLKTGFWKVKLVISPQQLLEILSQESTTQELIDNVRTVAKCGNANGTATPDDVGAFSDQRSLSSSRNGSKKDFILDL